MPEKTRKVEVLAHDPQWTALFRQEAAVLKGVFGEQAVAVHHIGSTCVPGLAAKPIIDLLLEVRDIEAVDLYNQEMRDRGYDPRGEYGLPRRRYFPRIIDGKRLSHVHTWQIGDPEFERHISFRDYLIAHPETRDAYGRLKEDLAAQFTYEMERYIDGKHQFCQETERQAVAWSRAFRAQAIQTDRLTLLPLNPAQLWLYLNRPTQLEAALNLRLSRDILAEPVRRAIRTKLRNMIGTSLEQQLWGTYWLVIINHTPLNNGASFGAGLIGFKGAPKTDGTVEIGYGIDAQVRRQGYATESVAALVGWALQQPECQAVTAATDKENAASIGVLKKLGFSMARETENMLCWIITESPGGPQSSSEGK